jgi:hypothetical protein
MNFLVKILIFCRIIGSALNANFHQSAALIKAVSSSIEELFISKNIEFEILIIDEKTKKIDDVIDGIGRANDGNSSVSIKFVEAQKNFTSKYRGRYKREMNPRVQRSNEESIKFNTNEEIFFQNYLTKLLAANPPTLRKSKILKKNEVPSTIFNKAFEISSVIFMKSLESLQAVFDNFFVANPHPKKMKFLIFCEELTVKDLQDLNETNFMFFENEEPLIAQSYFLLDGIKQVRLFTFEWFTEESCNKQQLKLVNTFDKISSKWQNQSLTIQDKFRNFHNCQFLIQFSIEENFLRKVVTKTFAQRINARVRFLTNVEYGHLGSNEFPYILIKTFEVLRRARSFLTATHDDENFVLAITPTMLFTNWEKLFLPFDLQIWIFLILTFLGSFLIIFIINQMPKIIQDLIYGVGVQTPAFNIVGTFFGMGQMKLPENSFGRIILMCFIIFNLIIRTAYQGVMFDMMTKDMYRLEPKTVQDLIDMDYKVIYQDGRFESVNHQILFEVLNGDLM